MRFRVSVNVGGAIAQTRDIETTVSDFTPFFEGPLDEVIETFLLRRFESEGAYGGVPWPPLAESTIKEKRRLGKGGQPILRRFDDMFKSFVDSADPFSVKAITPSRYARGSQDPKARYHQGDERPSVRIPRREIIPRVQPAVLLDEIERRLAEYLAERVE